MIGWLAQAGERLRRSIVAPSLVACGAALVIVASSVVASAEPSDKSHTTKPRTIVFAPRTNAANAGKDAARVTRQVRSAIEELELGELLAEPPLDLEALQLTIDCVGDSASCLREVARRSHAQIVIALSVERAHGSVVLRALYFDADGEDEPRRVEQRAQGDVLSSDLLEAVPDLMRELFGAEPATEAAAPSAPARAPATEDDQAVKADKPAASKALPLGPLLLGAGGVAVIAAGFTVGALMKSTEGKYADRAVETQEQAARADDDRRRGQQQARVANVLLGVGVAALLAGGIWLAASFAPDSEPAPVQTAIVPVIDAHSAGLALVGAWRDRL